MLDNDRSEQVLDGEVLDSAEPACVALVPVTATVHWLPKRPLPRPDPGFVTQLIATAEQAPQTRNLRRGSPADARIAYGPHPRPRVGARTRQII
jgi:hypothetical protein